MVPDVQDGPVLSFKESHALTAFDCVGDRLKSVPYPFQSVLAVVVVELLEPADDADTAQADLP